MFKKITLTITVTQLVVTTALAGVGAIALYYAGEQLAQEYVNYRLKKESKKEEKTGEIWSD